MRESLSLASIYKKFQSLEQKQILKFELKLENNEVPAQLCCYVVRREL